MATAQDLIKGAYRSIGVIGQGKTMSSFLAKNGLEALNQMLGMWSTQDFLIPARVSESLSIATAGHEFTIGTGGDFDTDRPEEIVDGYVSSGGTDYSLEVFTMGEYNDIRTKNVGIIPSRLWYEPSYPLGKIYLDGNIGIAYTLHIDSYKPLTSFPTLTTAVSLPAGYEEAIKFNLALRLAPENGKTPNQMIYSFAESGVNHLKTRRASQRTPVSKMPAGLSNRRGWNILSDGGR